MDLAFMKLIAASFQAIDDWSEYVGRELAFLRAVSIVALFVAFAALGACVTLMVKAGA